MLLSWAEPSVWRGVAAKVWILCVGDVNGLLVWVWFINPADFEIDLGVHTWVSVIILELVQYESEWERQLERFKRMCGTVY